MGTTSTESRSLSAKQRLAAALINFGRITGRKTGLGGTRASRNLSRMLYRFAFPQDAPTLAVSYRGVRLTAPEGDRAALPLLSSNSFEELEISTFERLAAASRGIFDVGANIGIYSCIGAGRILRGGSVTSFEPAPDNLVALRRNLELNGFSDVVRVIDSAAGAADGQLDLLLTEGNSFTHRASTSGIQETSTLLSVSAISLDSYLARSGNRDPDIVKVDVEGYEPFVLQGAEQLIKRSLPTIFIEYLPDNIRNCEGDPEVLLQIIFGNYRNVFAIDDECGLLAPLEKSDLTGIERRHPHCFNLLAVSRFEHLELLPKRAARPWNCFH